MTLTTHKRTSRSLAGAIVWLGVAYAVSLVGYLAVIFISARLLGPDGYGSFLVLTTVAFVVGQLALFGAHRAGLREVARLDKTDLAGLSSVGREGAAIVCIAVPAVALAATAVYLGAGGTELDGTRVLLGSEFGLLICLNAFQKLGANYLRGLRRLATASLVDGSSGGALTLTTQGLTLAVLLWQGYHPSLPVVLAVVCVGYLPSLAVVGVLLRGMWMSVRPAEMVACLRRTIVSYRLFAVIQVVAYAGVSVEIWLAALVLDTHSASYFGAAQRLALMFAVPLTALQSVASPAISRMAMGAGHDRLEAALRTSASLALGMAGVLAVPVLLFPGRVLAIFFGNAPGGFATVLVILVVGQLVDVATGMCAPVLSMSGSEATVASATTIGLALRVSIGLPAGLLAGGVGLGLSSLFITSGMWMYLVVQARARCRLNTLPTLRPRLASLHTVQG